MDIGHDELSIGFMPPLLPDELLYSFLARASAINALGKPKQCITRLFGSSNAMAIRDLPTRLQFLHDRLGSYSPVSRSQELVEVGTLYPYHRPFLSSERDHVVTQLLLYGDGKGLKSSLGLLANRFGAGLDMKICSSCVQEDIGAFGTTYWHRSHQLPGVTLCQKHAIVLTTQRPYITDDQKRRFLLPSWDGKLSSGLVHMGGHQRAFSLISAELLNAGLPALGQRRCGRVYSQAIGQMGLRKRGHVQHADLAASLREYYDDFVSFPHRERLLSTQKTPLAWISPIIERPDRACHPICHLILINFLFGSLQAFLKALDCVDTDESLSVVSRMHEVAQVDLETEAILKNSSLSCRSAARMIGMSVTSVVSKRRALGIVVAKRRKYISEDRIANVLALLKDRHSAPEVATLCHLSLSTVYRIRRENVKVFLAEFLAADERNLALERDKRRCDLLTASKSQSRAGVNAVRLVAPAAYAWLYRHDREWLTTTCARFQTCRPSQLRVDWSRRDRELCARLKKLAAELQLGFSRHRVSRSLLTRMIGQKSFSTNEHHLPKLKKLVDSLEEPPFSYELRRLDMAVHELYLAGEPLSMWRVKRAAGIRAWTETHSVYLSWKTKTVLAAERRYLR